MELSRDSLTGVEIIAQINIETRISSPSLELSPKETLAPKVFRKKDF